jgi:hypothetical protein
MKNKVLVEVLVPAAEKKFDVFIPAASRMSEIKMLISGVIGELSDGKFQADKTSVLCDAESGNIFDVNKIVAELGIKNGSRLLYI